MLTLILTALTRGPGLAPVPANWTLANFRGRAFPAGRAPPWPAARRWRWPPRSPRR